MNGLTDGQQAALTLVSLICIAVGGVSVPAGLPLYVGLVLGTVGAVGVTIKELLGTPKKA